VAIAKHEQGAKRIANDAWQREAKAKHLAATAWAEWNSAMDERTLQALSKARTFPIFRNGVIENLHANSWNVCQGHSLKSNKY